MDIADKMINNLANQMLEYYKDGEHSFDENAKSQTKSHYNHKGHIKKWLVDSFNHILQSTHGKTYIQPFFEIIKLCDPENNNSIKNINNQLKNKIKHMEERLKLKTEGQDTSTCGVCFYKIKEAQQAFEKQYAIDNNLTTFQDEIKSLREKCYKNNMDCIKYESIINELKEDLQNMKYELNHLKMENESLRSLVSENETKPDKKSKKKKKKKTSSKKDKKKLLKLLAQQLNDSSSEEESDSDSDSESD